MIREANPGLVARMRSSLSDMEDLYREVSQDLFIPRRFRKEPFTKKVKDSYLTELGWEIVSLKNRIERAENPGGKA